MMIQLENEVSQTSSNLQEKENENGMAQSNQDSQRPKTDGEKRSRKTTEEVVKTYPSNFYCRK